MQKFIPVFQDVIGLKRLECQELKDSSAGLDLLFESADGARLIMNFQGHLTYRLMDEGDALEAFSQLTKGGCTGKCMYKVENSQFTEWFHQQSFGVRINDALTHYAIFSNNDVIDVISFDEPSLTWGLSNDTCTVIKGGAA